MMKSLLLVVACLGLAAAETRYDGAQVLEVVPTSKAHLEQLHTLIDHYDFWVPLMGIGQPAQIMAKSEDLSYLQNFIKNAGLSYIVSIEDVQTVIDNAAKANNEALQKITNDEGRGAMEWTAFHTYDDIMTWCDKMADDYPSLVTVEDVGYSYEGRIMKLLKVSTGGTGKPEMFIDGGIHAREWASPSTVTWMINELVTNSAAYQSSLDAVDFYFMPLINPDGYNYTWSDDRMWRKTRSVNAGSNCFGCDPNRNWSYKWGESGSSSDPCTETYKGATAFSEIETQVVRDQMLKLTNNQIYITYHSYSQLIVYPWGYAAVCVDDWQDLDDLANAAYDEIYAVDGKNFTVGNSGEVYGAAAGASDDYAKGEANFKYSYTIELRPKSSLGGGGFELPPDEIIVCGQEQFAGFKVFFEFIRDTYGA